MSVQQRRVFSLFTWIGNKWTISIKFLFSSFWEFLARDLKKEKTKFPGRFEWRMKRNEELFRSGRDSTCWVRVRNDPKSRYPLHTHTHRDTCISCKLVEREKRDFFFFFFFFFPLEKKCPRKKTEASSCGLHIFFFPSSSSELNSLDGGHKWWWIVSSLYIS